MWQVFNKVYCIPEPSLLDLDGGQSIPIRVFINDETGEIKTFANKFVEENGTQSIINKLNGLSA